VIPVILNTAADIASQLLAAFFQWSQVSIMSPKTCQTPLPRI